MMTLVVGSRGEDTSMPTPCPLTQHGGRFPPASDSMAEATPVWDERPHGGGLMPGPPGSLLSHSSRQATRGLCSLTSGESGAPRTEWTETLPVPQCKNDVSSPLGNRRQDPREHYYP